ncbi:hypothetical protein THASP1DRAFT_14483 [Thamnocephalis sphaerospora]|uniref:DUF726 domain-containing protein n=1 Tax=Thamnocephalis sphaerospora TaxID=78915 RepID=A0A4P9XT09_9FUNG|nr:hypothetical protein THASP1DRAFT_14483 [Thamnocephalis sphaerospora]|eukprot:RKP09283.1 hypothetical protein THASP1DRAFT_14483 [Thamnocephalis sphaerospora]
MLEAGEYDARSRAVLYYIAKRISLPAERLCGLERWVAHRLFFAREAAAAHDDDQAEQTDEDRLRATMKSRNKRGRLWRWTATGTSVVVGAVALGLTGGLAAPLLAAGIGMLGVTWAGALATVGGIALVTSLFGVAGGGLTGYRMARRTGGLSEFAFLPIGVDPKLPVIPSLHATIVVPGYLKPGTDATMPWRVPCARHLGDRDVYALAYDTQVLQELGKAFREFLATQAASYAAGQVLKHTALAAIMTPLAAPMTLVKLGSIIDNPWGMAVDRARKAGLVLADVLQERVQGRRPVTLVGYSVGALTIFECLQALADRGCYGLVDSAVLLGAPVGDDRKLWRKARSVVSNRLVNGYVGSDWILAFLCRVHDQQLKPAGLMPIPMPGVESVDLSGVINGHLGYRKQLDAILSVIDIS